MDRQNLLLKAIDAAIAAGEKILEVYHSDFAVDHKEDRSPLTLADQQAHQEIVCQLSSTDLPLLSEEGKQTSYEERSQWGEFWLVDPLDGTKEFIKRNGEFTVNIALIVRGNPVAGVIWVPVKRQLYFADVSLGAYRINGLEEPTGSGGSLEAWIQRAVKLPCTSRSSSFVVVASRSHLSKETEEFVNELRQKHGDVEMLSMGSSLKLCLVAEGSADVYPRFAPTMEWDTAAGQAIVQAAGKAVIEVETKSPMRYNKADLLNPWFIVQ